MFIASSGLAMARRPMTSTRGACGTVAAAAWWIALRATAPAAPLRRDWVTVFMSSWRGKGCATCHCLKDRTRIFTNEDRIDTNENKDGFFVLFVKIRSSFVSIRVL